MAGIDNPGLQVNDETVVSKNSAVIAGLGKIK